MKEIPETFVSIDHYLMSYITPLVEETHADLLSCMSTVSRAPSVEVLDVITSSNFEPPKHLYYQLLLEKPTDDDEDDSNWIPILFSNLIPFQQQDNEKGEQGDKLFVVYLTNLTTNIRIWNALHSDPYSANLKIIKTVLQSDVNNVSYRVYVFMSQVIFHEK